MRAAKITRFFTVTSSAGLGLYLLMANTTPFGVTETVRQGMNSFSALGPKSRVTIEQLGTKLLGDTVYFGNQMPFHYENALLRAKVYDPYPDQEVRVGYRDEKSWHYDSSAIRVPFIDGLNWSRTGDGPYLYQKNPSVSSVKDFLANPPKGKLIGAYDYEASALKQDAVVIPGYKPAKTETVIDTPLRGKFTMYVYLEKEPFNINFVKQDLNWYEDPDVATITVYKGQQNVYQATIDDDGNDTADHKLGAKQTISVKNPGPENPEVGAYKVVVDAPNDVIITSMTMNLHKVVFEGPIYPVANPETYGGIIKQTTPTKLFTNARNVTATAFHQVPQTIMAGGKPIVLNAVDKPVEFDPGSDMASIVIPKSDVVINGVGYFSFSEDQFFAPSPYRILQVKTPQDLQAIDFLITNYSPPKSLGGGWYDISKNFDIRDAIIQKRKLSWIISSPGLAENNRWIAVKDLEMTLTKSGWMNK